MKSDRRRSCGGAGGAVASPLTATASGVCRSGRTITVASAARRACVAMVGRRITTATTSAARGTLKTAGPLPLAGGRVDGAGGCICIRTSIGWLEIALGWSPILGKVRGRRCFCVLRASAVGATVGVETVVLRLPLSLLLLLLLAWAETILALLLLAEMGWRRSAARERVEARGDL